MFRKKLRRAQVLEFFSAQPACTVAMEACGGARHWGREIGNLGHSVRLILLIATETWDLPHFPCC